MASDNLTYEEVTCTSVVVMKSFVGVGHAAGSPVSAVAGEVAVKVAAEVAIEITVKVTAEF